MVRQRCYRGRLAPSPTGYLYLGHACTFWVAWQRARTADGKLVFRNEDLDYQRCKPVFVTAMYEDLRWIGLKDLMLVAHSLLIPKASAQCLSWRSVVAR